MYVKLDVGDDDVWRDMDVRETYPIHRTGDFWSELARGSEGDLSTRGGDLRVLFQPTCAGDFGELRVHFGGRGEMRG